MSKRSKEFNAMTVAQLNDKLGELKMELIKHNAQIATGTTPKSPGLIRETKRNIARIRTIMKSKTVNEVKEDKKLEGVKKKYE